MRIHTGLNDDVILEGDERYATPNAHSGIFLLTLVTLPTPPWVAGTNKVGGTSHKSQLAIETKVAEDATSTVTFDAGVVVKATESSSSIVAEETVT